MRIGLIGTGPMSLCLSQGWSQAGHVVTVGSRQPGTRLDFARQVAGVDLSTILQTIQSSEIVIMAIPYIKVAPLARQYADSQRETLVVDISNPYEHLPEERIAGAELTAQAIGKGARVVAALKTNTWETLLEPIDPITGVRRDVFIAGDNFEDKQIVGQLVADLGFRPVDCGELHVAHVLDVMVPLMTTLDAKYARLSKNLSWKLLG